jgi:hypothetical protein
MIKKLRKSAEQVVETPVVETPAIETPVVETPVAAETPEAKAKKARYAPTSVLVDTAIITVVKANPKRAGTKAHGRYEKYHRVGQSVAEYIAAYKANNEAGMLARNDLRWDLEHGHIELGQPEA